MYEIGKQIKDQPVNGLQVQKIIRNKSLEILSISLEKEAVLPKHTSPKNALLVVLEGALDFFIDGQSYPLDRLEDFSIPENKVHHVVARENSKFLIIR